MPFRDTQFETSNVYSGEQLPEFMNPRFIYPSRVVRMAENPAGQRGPGAVSHITVPLKSGFMRNITTGYGTGMDLPKTRLNFQFNPEQIQQEVVSRQDMYLSVLQDPAQLSQPVAGNANFRFDLLFDRTMEVKNGGRRGAILDDPPGVSPGDGGPGDAADIGVLADLQVMYSIIGQGMNSMTVSEQTARIKDITKREFERAVRSQDPFFNEVDAFTKGVIESDEPIIYKKRDFEELYNKAFKDYANVNMGNAAFLVPMPVRVIFSSLYMVDGFVVKSSVLFTKFSTNLVPIQCRVLLEVNAVYLGFARDTTFLTQQINANVSSERQARTLTQAEVNTFINEYANKYLKNLVVSFSGDTTKANPFVVPLFAVGDLGGIYKNPSAASFVAKGEWWSPSGDDNPSIAVGFLSADDKSNSKIDSFYKDGGLINIEQAVKVEVYGPYTNKSAAEKDTNNTAARLGMYTQRKSVGSSDSWSKGVWAFQNSPSNSANISTGAVSPQQILTPEQLNSIGTVGVRGVDFLNSYYSTKWFKFVVTGTINVSGNGGVNATGTSSGSSTNTQTFYAQGNENIGSKAVTLTFNFTAPKTSATRSVTGTATNTPSTYSYLNSAF